MADDPKWPRASVWLADYEPGEPFDLALLGLPAHLTSISPTGADQTPAAIRAALARFSTWVTSAGVDLRDLRVTDLGDVPDPDTEDGERATAALVRTVRDTPVVALGGDNSITYAVAQGAGADGLITLDAHHDLRDGRSNGSPVQRLIEAGLAGKRVVQIGIADFANSPEYAARARDHGITVVPRAALHRRPMTEVMAEALQIAGSGPAGRVHLDLDVDVCDRSVAPGCPASLPGGLSAAELLAAARAGARDPRVVSFDIAEVDATADTRDQRTVRLAALCVLEIAAGVALRERRYVRT